MNNEVSGESAMVTSTLTRQNQPGPAIDRETAEALGGQVMAAAGDLARQESAFLAPGEAASGLGRSARRQPARHDGATSGDRRSIGQRDPGRRGSTRRSIVTSDHHAPEDPAHEPAA
jgi:hypothetical protein